MATKRESPHYQEIFERIADNLVSELGMERETITAETRIPGYGGGIWAIQNVLAEYGINASFSSWSGLTAGKLAEMVADVLEGSIINRDGITMS
jgi:hypothetical protein